MIIIELICLISILLPLFSYIIYPYVIILLSKRISAPVYNSTELPFVSILMAVYNEESIIEQKVVSMLASNYPKENMEILIGIDLSTDKTEEILRKFEVENSHLKITAFTERTGKAKIMDLLVENSQSEILIFTDADAIFTENTILELVKPYEDKAIGGVQSNIESIKLDSEEIFEQESKFNKYEMQIKQAQGKFGLVIGAIGSMFSIRKVFYEKMPEGIIVDDLYLFLNVLKNGSRTVFAEKSITKLFVSGEQKSQFKRKIRIGSGNFMAMGIFRKFANPLNEIGFHFFTYKIVRWFGGFFMIALLLFGLLFWSHGTLFQLSALATWFICLVTLADVYILKDKTNIPWARNISHFTLMNIALMLGFFKNLRREKSGIWENQKTKKID